jgi:hypothetical protein
MVLFSQLYADKIAYHLLAIGLASSSISFSFHPGDYCPGFSS